MNTYTNTILHTLKQCNEMIRNNHGMKEHDVHNCTEIMNKAIELLNHTYNEKDFNSASNSRRVIESCLMSFMRDKQNTLMKMDDTPFFICKTWV